MLERRFLDRLAIGAYRLDDAGSIVEANSAAAELLGLVSADAAVGRDARDFLVANEWADGFFAMLRKSGVINAYRTPLRRFDDRKIWVEHHAEMREDDGRLVIDGIFLDCTALVESEQSIARAYRSLDSLVKYTPGVAIQIYDRSGVVHLWNPASEQLYGYTAQEAIGRNFRDFLPADLSTHFNETVARVSSTGVGTDPGLWTVRHRNGSMRHVWSTMFPLPLIDAGEPLVGCMDVDVSEEQKTRERLETSRRQLADSERVAHVGSWEWITAQDKLWWSEELCRIWGVEYTPLPTRSLGDFIASLHPDDREQARTKVETALQSGEPFVFEHRVIRPDGSIREVMSRGEVILGSDGKAQKLFGTVQDITFARRSEELLRRKDAQLKVMVEQMPAFIWTTDRELVFTSCRGRALSALGLADDELAGRSVVDYFNAADEAVLAHRRALQGKSSVFLENREGVWLQSHVEALRDADGSIAGCIGVAHDVTEQRAAEEQVAFLAYHDALTGLPNRMLLNDRLTLAIAQAERRNTEVGVIFLDLDHFKLINDTLGHGTGDRMLQNIATRLRASIRSEDTIARVGGDEFVIVLPHIHSPDDAARVANHLLQVVSIPFSAEAHTLYATASSGIAIYPRDGRTAEDLLRSADSAMYRAKDVGRNNYQLCTPELTAHALERLSIENGIRRGLEEKQFVVYYQPIVDLATRTVVGVEALMRWNDPERGLVYPTTFIPVAEESRLILPLGDWLLEDAARQMKEWQARNVAIPRMSINISPRQFQHGDIAERVEQALAKFAVDPRCFEIEITESSAMQNVENAVLQMRRLAQLGVGIVIDDFGVGYSSLNYLKRLPITGLKIDRSFLSDLPARSATAIVQAIISTARALGLRLTAEGVENEAQAVFLREAGCPAGQGYLFARPMPADEVEAFVAALR